MGGGNGSKTNGFFAGLHSPPSILSVSFIVKEGEVQATEPYSSLVAAAAAAHQQWALAHPYCREVPAAATKSTSHPGGNKLPSQ